MPIDARDLRGFFRWGVVKPVSVAVASDCTTVSDFIVGLLESSRDAAESVIIVSSSCSADFSADLTLEFARFGAVFRLLWPTLRTAAICLRCRGGLRVDF